MPENRLIHSFVAQLEAFTKNDYRFANGQLREGTQREAVEGYLGGLRGNNTSGHFEIPTGVGKTAIFIALIHNFLEATKKAEADKRVLVVAPSTDLVIQTAQGFARFLPDLARLIEADDDLGEIIDWANSEIGAQYSKLKHATFKPKVLITTYQSLAKDGENRIYPPEEYGLVVYDEGHFITGPKFSRSIAKFENSMQLAVTATREYSQDKNVQLYLPHEYYGLPIKTAMERGDLCGVQPIIVQTDFTVDKKAFDRLMQERNGRPLTEKQTQHLFNQESRNRAIIETYLRGRDSDTGEQFFGQTGLIFAAGVKHCSDLNRQFKKMPEKPEYLPFKNWLKREGIALVAEIHGKTEGEELTIDGKKRFYTKDEIKKLHRDGKILLLISDQELKQGTDFPADSIIMDVVDRYSWVDTKQRYGRGYRLNPDDPDKVCKVFNFIDQNTRELYGELPENMPIYCAETLEGVQFEKKPSLLAFKRFKEAPPSSEEALHHSGFTLITDLERVREISTEHKKIRERTKYPEKTAEFLAIGSELPKRMNVSFNNHIYAKWRAETEARIANGEIVQVGEHQVQKMKPCKGPTSLCLHEEAIPVLARQLQLSQIEKTNQHLTLSRELPERMNTNSKNPIYTEWRAETEARIVNGEIVQVGEHKVQKMKSGSLCLHEDAVPALAKQLGIKLRSEGLPEKTEKHLTLSADLPRYMGTDHRNQTYIKWKTQTEEVIARGETVSVGKFLVQEMTSRASTSLCLHQDAVPVLAKQLGIKLRSENLPEKTDKHLTLGKQLPKEIHIDEKHSVYVKWKTQTEEAIARGETVSVGKFLVQEMTSRASASLCLHKDAAPILAKQLGIKLRSENIPEKTKKHLALGKSLPEQMHIDKKNSVYLKWKSQTEEAITRGETVSVGRFLVQEMRSGSKLALCLHEDAIPALRKILAQIAEDKIGGDKKVTKKGRAAPSLKGASSTQTGAAP